jgi:ATP-dependent protease ClpP protease subunit
MSRREKISILQNVRLQEKLFDVERTIHWIGSVNAETSSDIIISIQKLLKRDEHAPINLVVTSPGGASGIAMSFYDSIKHIYRPLLYTVGSGDVDSSGIILFLSGIRRYITPHTTLFLHLAGRTFDRNRRISTQEMEAMLKEDKLKDFQYASIVAEHTNGRLSVQDVLDLMARNTVLTPTEAVDYGLAHEILTT